MISFTQLIVFIFVFFLLFGDLRSLFNKFMILFFNIRTFFSKKSSSEKDQKRL